MFLAIPTACQGLNLKPTNFPTATTPYRLKAEQVESMVTVVAESVINVNVQELRRLGIDEVI
ncbi:MULTISPECIES: hypothetical protein [unclassified Microcoleus]|uniref:hypothetical protein n=1 Tax=unclassified Microcoleus TaxID=2642155 RepID=UPI002FD64D95